MPSYDHMAMNPSFGGDITFDPGASVAGFPHEYVVTLALEPGPVAANQVTVPHPMFRDGAVVAVSVGYLNVLATGMDVELIIEGPALLDTFTVPSGSRGGFWEDLSYPFLKGNALAVRTTGTVDPAAEDLAVHALIRSTG